MSKHRRPSVFLSGKRDSNEKDITAVLDRCGIPFVLMPPTAGFDLLVFTPHVELWEVKNSELKWSLTRAEQERKNYCKANGITYRVIERIEQAVNALNERR
jgi:hypothetical protein